MPDYGRHKERGSGWQLARLASDLADSAVMSVFFDAAGIGFLSCTHAVFCSPEEVCGPVSSWLVQSTSRWLPAYVQMELNEN